MKILNEYPPNFDEIVRHFPPHYGTYYTYGDTIYNPDGVSIDEPIIAHEKIHERQQNEMGVLDWWRKYCVSKSFRASQEIEAYQMQYKVGKKLIKDKNQLARWLNRLALELSGELYGNIMSIPEAVKAIKEEAPIRFRI